MYDVIAVNMQTHKVEVLATNKSERNAEAIETMAIMRRGVETHFFATVPSGKYSPGDEWNPENEE